MKSFFYLSLLLILIYPGKYAFSQEIKSIHQLDYEQHKNEKHEKSFFKENGDGIIPLKVVPKFLKNAIFGYLPYWEYATDRNYLNYDLLSYISAFEFDVSSNGSISNPTYWPWTDVINAAHAKGVKIIMTAVYFDAAGLHTLLTSSSAQQILINNIISKIKTYLLDGVNVDFENLGTGDRGSLLNSFMSDLTNNVHQQFPNAEVSFAAPALNSSGWDLSGLANACDYLFIMGYDFYGSWSTITGPVAPLMGINSSDISVFNTVSVQYRNLTQTLPNKLILGVPYYGEKWKTVDSLPHSKVVTYMNSTRFSDDQNLSLSYGLIWAADNRTPWYRYKSGGEWYQVWFDNDSSLGLKYNLADAWNYKGVGIWALGYDGSRPELWNELRRRYYNQTVVGSEVNQQVNDFRLFQNYPNPFNPNTTIGYQIPVNGYVILKIFDVMGREIAKLVSQNQPAGYHEAHWNAINAPSGLYYYQIQAGSYTATRKLILLK